MAMSRSDPMSHVVPLEDDDPDDADDHHKVGREETTEAAMEAALESGDHDQNSEEREEREPDDGAKVGHPFHVAQREDVHGHGAPDEEEADDRFPALLAVELAAPQRVEGGDRGGGQRAAEPDRVGEPVQDADHRAREVAVRKPYPVIGGAFGRESSA